MSKEKNKKTSLNKNPSTLDAVFCVEKEVKPNNGEDSYYYSVEGKNVMVAVFDGCGGIGSKRYGNYSGKTGAYIASRAVCGAVGTWFKTKNRDPKELYYYVKRSLEVCEGYADKTSRFIGSLGKSFPTTAAIICAREEGKKIKATCMWAGDSRCYMLNSKGLHQLSADDVNEEDAYSNLKSDGVLTNVICASIPFEIRIKEITVDMPCILFTATDGCFGYLKTPMDFEYLLTNLMMKSKNLTEWKKYIYDNLQGFAGDDYTMSVAVFGYGDFRNMQANFVSRNEYVYNTFINSPISSDKKWDMYKTEYYTFY